MRVHIVRRSLLELSRSKVEIVETVSYVNKLRCSGETFLRISGRDYGCSYRDYQHIQLSLTCVIRHYLGHYTLGSAFCTSGVYILPHINQEPKAIVGGISKFSTNKVFNIISFAQKFSTFNLDLTSRIQISTHYK